MCEGQSPHDAHTIPIMDREVAELMMHCNYVFLIETVYNSMAVEGERSPKLPTQIESVFQSSIPKDKSTF